MIETDISAEDRIRVWMRQYQENTGIGQIEYAKRLGVSQSALSRWLTRRIPLTGRFARSIYAAHPELRPLVLGWLAQSGEGDKSIQSRA